MRNLSFAASARARALAWTLLALAFTTTSFQCARSVCTLNSDCPDHSRCVTNRCITECTADRDCPAARPVCSINGQCVEPGAGDAGDVDAVVTDASRDTGSTDASPPRDVPMVPDVPITPDVPMTMDAPVAPDVPMSMDVPVTPDVPPLGVYLDRCTMDSDCASGMCSRRGLQICTHRCASIGECAHGQVCANGRCELDDTGKACNPTAPDCARFCLGTATAAHCTHECTSAGDCPAGYACSQFGTEKVCVNIEKSCTDATQCPSSKGFCGPGGLGCTADCVTASDCPTRLPGFPPYTCEANGGSMVCVPPADITGSDPLGSTCPATGTPLCRSDACDTGTSPPTCIQECTPRGGCPIGFGCFPLVDGTDVYLVCTAAGSGWLGDYCDRARDCLTGLCSSNHYCTRLCDDGYCPSGMTCMDAGVTALDGTRIALCTR